MRRNVQGQQSLDVDAVVRFLISEVEEQFLVELEEQEVVVVDSTMMMMIRLLLVVAVDSM